MLNVSYSRVSFGVRSGRSSVTQSPAAEAAKPLLVLALEMCDKIVFGGVPPILSRLLIHPDLRGVRRVGVVADALREFFGKFK